MRASIDLQDCHKMTVILSYAKVFKVSVVPGEISRFNVVYYVCVCVAWPEGGFHALRDEANASRGFM